MGPPLASVAIVTLPGWAGYVFVAAVMAYGLWRGWVWHQDAKRELAEYVTPPEQVVVAVAVRGGDPATLARFAKCWNRAFETIAAHGPWMRPHLLAQLGPGNRVQIRETNSWSDSAGGKVGGQLIANVMHVGPDLSVLCHELIHRCEEVVDPEHMADNAHVTWQGRGLKAADESYRAWLKGQA